MAHAALIEALGGSETIAQPCGYTDDSGPAKGPFFCFARRHKLDVVVGGEKLAGSAQRRTRHAVLQHGSIVLERRYKQQPAAAVSALTFVDPHGLAERMTHALHRRTQISFATGTWNEKETSAVGPFISKHANDAWLRRT